MANGIANNEKKEKKTILPEQSKNHPSGGDEMSNVCVTSFGKTPTKGLTGVKGLSIGDRLKAQIENGEYKAIKISDKPIQIENEKDSEPDRN